MSHLQKYLTLLKESGNPELSEAVKNTANDIIPKYVRNFTFNEHVVSLLMGNVQSGKTSHVFGIMAAAADEGFGIFVLLTTDNILLQQQTLKRTQRDLTSFCVCGEEDYLTFLENNMKQPVVIVLKKNGHVLRQWRNNFYSTKFCAGNPLFIIDDEADAASLNTSVNKNGTSRVHATLTAIKQTSSSSIYLQVTGTPQAVLLQTVISGWKPYFIHYFEPGKKYLGGDFFYGSEGENKSIIFTDSQTLVGNEEEYSENQLFSALLFHLISSAHLYLKEGAKVSNFLIHPSHKTHDHRKFAKEIGKYIASITANFDTSQIKAEFWSAYQNLYATQPNLCKFDDALNFIKGLLSEDKVSIYIMNSLAQHIDNEEYENGINIIVGGNSLGRGVTFPKLHTIFYCRQAKRPQADTMWQHSRMFGYDRIPGLMRVFISPELYKLFSDINQVNNAIVAQIKKFDANGSVKLYYPSNINPTRKNVIDSSALQIIAGGVNYFPLDPVNNSIEKLDEMLSQFSGDEHFQVSLKLISALIGHFNCDPEDWNGKAFIDFINAFTSQNSTAQGILIVRRERDIGKGTGTLLSPNDRSLGQSFTSQVVLTLYKVTGNKGWNGEKLWVPNIKLPEDLVFYEMRR